jgi:hypothetical protein
LDSLTLRLAGLAIFSIRPKILIVKSTRHHTALLFFGDIEQLALPGARAEASLKKVM